MNSVPFASMGLGFLLGIRHAFEADHLAAVAAIVSRERSPVRSGFLGASWGLGHLASLLLVGLPVVGFGLRFPTAVDLPLELGVAAMIVLLGVGGLRRTREADLSHAHDHGLVGVRKPFWVGAMHGLAGSGALTLLILATLPGRAEGLFYLSLFGVGSIAGMTAASVAVSLPVAIVGNRMPRSALRLTRAVSFASVLFGLFYGATTLAAAIARHPLGFR